MPRGIQWISAGYKSTDRPVQLDSTSPWSINRLSQHSTDITEPIFPVPLQGQMARMGGHRSHRFEAFQPMDESFLLRRSKDVYKKLAVPEVTSCQNLLSSSRIS